VSNIHIEISYEELYILWVKVIGTVLFCIMAYILYASVAMVAWSSLAVSFKPGHKLIGAWLTWGCPVGSNDGNDLATVGLEVDS
jgi:hypothetical protein